MNQKSFFRDKKLHVFAHRGGNASGKGTENTLMAFSSAYDLGYRYLETDVVVTRDKQVVTYHGARNQREASKTGYMTRKYIQSLDYQTICEQVKSGEQRVPLLKDVLTAFPDAKFSIDVKTAEVVAPFAEVIKSTKSFDSVCVASFSLRRLARASGLLGGTNKVALAYCVHPRLSRLLRAFPGIFMRLFADRMIDCLHVHTSGISSGVISKAHANGIVVYAWTVNDAKDFERLKNMSVDGIITDETRAISVTTM